jgi:pilus assembly protein CpaC
MLVLLVATVVATCAQTPQQSVEPATRQRVTSEVPTVKLQNTQGPITLRVFVGKSLVVNSPEVLKRVSVTDPAIASAITVTPNQVLIHGLVPGSVTLILWDDRERMRTFDLQVEIDLSGLRDTMAQFFPSENIQVSQSGASILLTGTVTSKEVSDRAAALAGTQSKSVVNLLGLIQDNGEVLLQVRFAEVDRTAIQELGVNFISTGAANTPGAISTGQFGRPNVSGGVSSTIGAGINGTQTSFTLTDILNVFVFRPDLNLALTIRALEQKSVLQVLAEPNLLALNGREASFLAGGEFPFPVVQGGGNVTAVTIQFREFGVRLKFTPTILPDKTIRLRVAPEVSTLDFANGLTVSGFLVPAISSRKAETEIELMDGQSFAIAGLIDNRLTEVASKIPGLGDIPIIGRLFRSRSQNRNNTELLVMVTPRLVKPLAPGQVPPLPTFPKQFLDKDKFDGKAGAAPPKKN